MLSHPWWKIPGPILMGVLAVLVPLSVSAMTGVLVAVVTYGVLKIAWDNWHIDETWDQVN